MENNNKLKVLYHIPFSNTIYAGRTIYHGYKNAFTDMGHEFRTWTALDDTEDVLDLYEPDILMSGFGTYSLKYIDLPKVRKHKERGMKVFVSAPFWKSPLSKLRINENPSLCENSEHIEIIKQGYGDVYYNVCEQGDERMQGFEDTLGYKHYTIPLAADKTMIYPDFNKKFKADISFLGTNLPEKRPFFNERVYPLAKEFDLKLYGQDWTFTDKAIGFTQKVGQYFNIPGLRSMQKPKIQLEEEKQIYSSATISLNIHEEYQRRFGKDCNERTFKIPLCDGFEIVDNVECIKKYFKEGEEMIIAKDKDDWYDKIRFYMNNTEERKKVSEAGKKRVLAEHTYHNRVNTLIELYRELIR